MYAAIPEQVYVYSHSSQCDDTWSHRHRVLVLFVMQAGCNAMQWDDDEVYRAQYVDGSQRLGNFGRGRVERVGLLPRRRRLRLLDHGLLRVRRHVSRRAVVLVRHRGVLSRLDLRAHLRHAELIGHFRVLGRGKDALVELLPGRHWGHGLDVDGHHLAVVRHGGRDGHAAHGVRKGRKGRRRVLPRVRGARGGRYWRSEGRAGTDLFVATDDGSDPKGRSSETGRAGSSGDSALARA